MKRKIVPLLLAALLLILTCTAVVLTVCNKTCKHTYGDVTYTWSESNTACTATRTCTNCKAGTEGRTQTANATISDTVEQTATCSLPELKKFTATFAEEWATTQTKEHVETATATGHNSSGEWTSDKNEHWRVCANTGCNEIIDEAEHKDENHDHKCDACEYVTSEHTYGETRYIWNTDYTECTAYRTCTYCVGETDGRTQSVNASEITSKITQDVSCENPEKTTYSATFEGIIWAETQVEVIETAAKLGHDFTGSYNSSDSEHWRVCKRTNCNVTSEKVVHSDENKDHKCDVCQYRYSVHSYTSDYVWKWNDDYTECTLTRTCSYCTKETDGHEQSVSTTNISSTIKQNVSCESPEIKTYKADFDGLAAWADYHYKTIDVETSPKLNHDYRWAFNDSEHWQECKREGCDVTTEKESHSDNDDDHFCDLCPMRLSNCADENNDHYCDLCEKRLTYCKDEDGNKLCDICGTACKDDDNNHFCDDCGNRLSVCVDEDKDHVCDICKGTVGEHKQVDGKHYCAYCDKKTSDCADDDHDHKCDVCGEIESYHTYGDVMYTWSGDYTAYTGCTASKTCTYCTEETEGHTVYGHSTEIKTVKHDANCLTAGSIQYHATFDVDWASVTERVEIPALGHDLDDEWSYDSNSHWHKCQNGCEGIFNAGAHTYKSGICTVCDCYDVYGTEGLVFNYAKGNYHVIGYTGTATEVKIPYYYNNETDGYALVVSIVEAFKYNTTINRIILPDSVTTIDDYAFSYCSNLTTVEVGNNLTKIGANAFYCCSSLKTIDLGQNLISVGNLAFGSCEALTKIDLGEKLTSIGPKAFYYCSSLTEFTLPSTVTSYEKGILSGCNNLTKVTYPANVGTIGCLFGESTSYKKNADYLPETLTEVVINGGNDLCMGAFYGCTYIKTITISSSVKNIGSDAFKGCNGLTKVEFLYGTTQIPDGIFSGLSSLTTVVLPASITYIGSSAFSGCSKLTAIDVPDDVTYIGSSAFSGCEALNKVVIPSGVTSIFDNTFSGCTSLTSVEIKGDITIIGNDSFSGCSSLSNITIPKTVTNIGNNAFSSTNLTEIIIPDNVTIGDKAFQNCASLKTVVISPNLTSLGATILTGCTAVTDLTYSLSYGGLSALFGSTSYSNLTKIHINGGDAIPEKAFQNSASLTALEITCSMTSIGDYAFDGCSKLNNVSITGDITRIGNYVFYNCNSLTEAYLPSTLKSIGNNAFSNCSSIKSIVVPDGVTCIGTSAFEYCLELTTVTLPSTITAISNRAFYNCTELENINLPNTVTSIGNFAFYKCLKLENISIPDTVTSIGMNAFEECSVLKYNEYDNACYLGNDENPYVVLIKAKDTNIQSCKIHEDTKIIYYQAFKDCKSLTSIEIAKNVISIGVQAFLNCSSLESLTVSIDNQKYSGAGNAIVEKATKTLIVGSEKTVIPTDGSVTSIGDYAFCKNVKITSLVIPDSILSIGVHAFRGCTDLTEITLSKNLTSIGEEAFYECTSLLSVTIPGSVETWGKGVFRDCTSLKTVVIEEGIKNLGLSKGVGVFQNCTSLVSVTLPSTLTYIGYQTFRDCTSLTSIVIPENVTEIDDSAFSSCYKLAEVYNLSKLNITIGSWENGYVGYYAKVVHTSRDEESIVKHVNDFIFATINNVNYLICYVGTLTEITLPDNYNGESYVINDYAFYGLSSLQSVIIGKNVTSIGNYAFANCSSLQSVIIGNDVTSIGMYAFTGCRSLQSIVISDATTSIGKYAFKGCSSLEKVYYTGTADKWKGISIASGNTFLISATIYYDSE